MFDQTLRGVKARSSVSGKGPGSTRLQGPRSFELILTMLLSFSLSFAILMRERKTTAAPQTLASQPPANVRSEPTELHSRSDLPPPLASLPANATLVRPTAAPEAAEDTSHERDALPLAFNVYNRRARGKIEGFIKNMSGNSMSVSIQVVDASGQQTGQAELNLSPGEQKGFGTDSGLDIHSGQRVILRSPPYQDGFLEVP